MRPRLRPDVYCTAVDGGAHLLTPAGPVRLTGASIAAWIQRLTPYLDGRATLAELTASLSLPRRAMVEQVVTTLHRAGVVRDLGEAIPDPEDVPGALTPAESREYAPELGYLGYFVDRSAEAFARYRNRPALLVGSGALLGPLLAAGLWSGLRQLRVVATADALAGLAAAPRRDPAQRVTYHAVADPTRPGQVAQAARLLAGAGLVLQAAGPDQPVGALERACAAADVPLAQAVVTGDEIWLVPPGGHGRRLPSPGWSAAARRLATAPDPGGPAADPAAQDGPVPGAPDPAALAAAAARLVQAGFRALTGVAEPDRAHLVRVSPDGDGSERHRFLPHPFALPAAPTAAADLPERVAGLSAGPRLSEEEFSQRAVRCLGQRLGLFAFPDNEWEQVPLQVTEAVVADPAGWLPAGSRPRTVGSGFTAQTARCESARRALARYATLLVDPRRLVDPRTRRPLTTDPDADPRPGAAWGYEVDAPDRVRPVPARSAFPVLADPSPELPVGVGAGYDWAEAVTAALASHAQALAVAGIGRATTAYPPVDLAAAAGLLDGIGERCRRLLTDLGELPECYDLTGPLGVPVFGFCRGTATVAVAAGGTAGAALADGLRRVLLAVQARAHDQPDYAPPPGPPLPAGLRGGASRHAGWPDSGPAPPERVAARLRAAGRVAVAVPLDHDPEVAGVLPYLVQVVIVPGDDGGVVVDG